MHEARTEAGRCAGRRGTRHRIRFENDPLRGEQLFIDGQLAARGRLGLLTALEAVIPDGAGAGDRIVAICEAGLMRFRCRLRAESEP